MLDDIIKNVQVCIPFRLLREKHLPMVIKNRINPEIGIDADTIDTYAPKDFFDMAHLLRQEGLSVTLHGPFFDLAPGGMDKKIVKATRERLRQAFDVLPIFDPKSIVCHTGYDGKRYREAQDAWLQTAVETWTPLLQGLGGTNTILAIENVYEKTPTMLVRLFNALNDDKVGFCFDTGHMNAFSETDMESWLAALGPFLKQLHLHDNDGTWDDHWAIGTGKVDFDRLFRHVVENRLRPIITLEAHQEDWLWQSLETLSESGLFRRLIRG